MTSMEFWMMLIIGYLISHLVERKHHAIVYEELKKHPHEEFLLKEKSLFFHLPMFFIPIAYLEYKQGGSITSQAMPIIGLSLLLIGTLLKGISIKSLGWFWTMKCIFVKGGKRPSTILFKSFRYPEYFFRVVEAFGLYLAIGSILTSITFVAVNSLILYRIIRFESKLQKEYQTYSRSLDYSS